MKIKKFKYKIVNSTNDTAINLIKNKKLKIGFIIADKQKKAKDSVAINGFLTKGIFLYLFFLV